MSEDDSARAVAAAEDLGLAYAVTRHGPVRSLEEAAAARGVEPRQIIKTMVVRITAAGTAMAAHADFQFDAIGPDCRIQVSIHSWMPGSTAEERTRMHGLTREKIAADFARLREILRGAR